MLTIYHINNMDRFEDAVCASKGIISVMLDGRRYPLNGKEAATGLMRHLNLSAGVKLHASCADDLTQLLLCLQ